MKSPIRYFIFFVCILQFASKMPAGIHTKSVGRERFPNMGWEVFQHSPFAFYRVPADGYVSANNG